ncbi:MAG TPA: ROK family transcriptional regulator [Defluviitoga sp.]|nr:ROK family transcriptional regulator [Defluviitoga sp.]HOP25221.1 ROK family transcriptional regulator [Defluviitoga sp.]HPZ29306.1 ROK family transcriptional regulator [Defluviitoga sp.]HQD63244.1 ROK family transcriptional regulator [Defluviitoga sp.]
MKKASLSSLKENNAALIFECLRNNGPMTRANIARQTNLMPSTVSYITNFLIQKKVIKEIGSEEVERVGKKGVLLDVNYDDFLFIGYDVGTAYSRAIVSDGKGDLYYSKKFRTKTGDELLQQIFDNIKIITDKYDVIGMGMAFPGFVDYERGVVIRAHNLGIKNLEIKKILKKEFNLTAYIDHNTIMMARDLLINNSSKEKDFVVVNIGPGIGVGIVSNEKIIRGYKNAAGELGHVTVNPEGRMCNCGKKGCLETESSSKGIVRNYAELSGKNFECEEECESSVIYQLAKKGDQNAIKAFERAGHYLGIGISTVVNILNPEKVYIAGGVAYGWEFLKDAAEKSYNENIFYANNETKIEVSPIGDYITALGAATFAFEKYIKEEIIA